MDVTLSTAHHYFNNDNHIIQYTIPRLPDALEDAIVGERVYRQDRSKSVPFVTSDQYLTTQEQRKRKQQEESVSEPISPKNRPKKRAKVCPILPEEFVTIFPDEIWTMIFGMLPAKALCSSVSLVCRHWRMLCSSSYLWREIPLDLSYSVIDNKSLDSATKIVNVLKQPKFAEIRKLCIGQLHVRQKTLSRIVTCCPYLETFVAGSLPTPLLTASGKPKPKTPFVNTNLRQLQSPRLRELSLPFFYYEEDGLPSPFEGYTNLEKLTLEAVTGSIARLIDSIANNCKNLTYLRIGTTASSVRNADLLKLAKSLPYLQVLHIRPCRAITDAGIIDLAKHAPNLTSLQMYQCCSITDEVVEALTENCPKLKMLELTHVQRDSPKLTPKAYRALDTKNIQAVNLPLCNTPSAFGANIPDIHRWSAISVIFTTLMRCLGREPVIGLNATNKDLHINCNQPNSPLEEAKIRNGEGYQLSLRLLFLAQRYEETAYQHSATLADYLNFLRTKSDNCEVACAKRRAVKQYRGLKENTDSDYEFLKEVLFIWFLGQTEPSSPGRWIFESNV